MAAPPSAPAAAGSPPGAPAVAASAAREGDASCAICSACDGARAREWAHWSHWSSHRGGAGGWQEHAPGRCALGARAIPKLQAVPPGARSPLQAAQRPHRATFVARRPCGAGRALSGGLGATRSSIFGAPSLAQPRGELGRPSGPASDRRRARTAAETLNRRSRDIDLRWHDFQRSQARPTRTLAAAPRPPGRLLAA